MRYNMKVIENHPTVEVQRIQIGQIFKYEGAYYIKTNFYAAQYMEEDKILYIDLSTGRHRFLRPWIKVELITDARLLVGNIQHEPEEDDE